MSKKTVSLILGSGGARGMAHIGVIRWLEENNYEIKSISGCSIGSLIGGYYAAGKLDIYTKWVKSLDVLDMLSLIDFQGSSGLMAGDKLMKKHKELIGDFNIEDLDITFTAVAADIDGEKEVWINSGSLQSAIRASVSLPLFFAPHPYGDKLLIDGGILNPVPIAPTFHDTTDITIAVNLGSEPNNHIILKEKKTDKDISSKIKNYLVDIALPSSKIDSYSVYSVANKSFDTMQSAIARMKLSAYPPDIEIKIPRDLCGILEFDRVNELIDYGYDICQYTFQKELK
ncbi:MAG: patatin-like phospholipase family protein [Campylobacterota bacterium]|nr:patatin-like phospholipase family protein [Campylobacterota bacterium]